MKAFYYITKLFTHLTKLKRLILCALFVKWTDEYIVLTHSRSEQGTSALFIFVFCWAPWVERFMWDAANEHHLESNTIGVSLIKRSDESSMQTVTVKRLSHYHSMVANVHIQYNAYAHTHTYAQCASATQRRTHSVNVLKRLFASFHSTKRSAICLREERLQKQKRVEPFTNELIRKPLLLAALVRVHSQRVSKREIVIEKHSTVILFDVRVVRAAISLILCSLSLSLYLVYCTYCINASCFCADLVIHYNA